MTLESSLTVSRCDPVTSPLTLALAAQAWPEAERPSHWQTVQDLIRQGRADDVILLAAYCGDSCQAALVAQVLAGRIAVAHPPSLADGAAERSSLAARLLLTALIQELSRRDVQMVQALLSKEQSEDAQLLAASGFSFAAELLLLTAPSRVFPDHELALPFQLAAYQPADHFRLVGLIDRTYQGTLDCPQIDGLRQTSDVITGYKAVGEFRPELWQFVRHEGRDVGCLLVAIFPETATAEIVYAALVPAVRGRGWGLELTRQAQWLARQSGCSQLVLAVDAENRPAIAMYAAAGFQQWDQKRLWIRALTRPSDSMHEN